MGWDNRFKVSFKNAPSSYDYAITGSDQVWHRWSEEDAELDYFYLRFMPEEKRISYAASFGFHQFPINDLEKHAEGLAGIRHLSCREYEGKSLINQITGREAEITLDPTLLLEKDDWQKIEKTPCHNLRKTDNYLLVYFLGEITDDTKKALEIIAQDNKLKIVKVYDINQPEYYLTTPDEFVWLVDHAAFVCTDSFHACVFSILFHKQFLAFRRQQEGMETMFGRIETLFQQCKIDRAYKGDISAIYKEYEIADISNLKEHSLLYLKNALSQ